MGSKLDELKKKRNAIILAHNYQRPEVQDVADFVGDSLELARAASGVECDVIVFCGVDFMAESAKVLNPSRTVLFPEPNAQCPMAAMITATQLRLIKAEHPGVPVVCYVNTSAEVKAESDICCTSANAAAVVNSLDSDEVIFVPDENLALYAQRQTKKKIIPSRGFCPTHHQITLGDVLLAREQYPEAKVMVHPECTPEVIDTADYVFSTSGMLHHATDGPDNEFIIGTELGLLYRLGKENPQKIFHPVSEYPVCPNMKMTTLDSIERSLENMQYPLEVPEDIRLKAVRVLEKMLAVKRVD
jgi:quinolinate synthase